MKSHTKGKLAALKELKKAYLQQMFPQEGESVPRLRFEGFDEPWEKRQLNDVLTESRIPGSSGLEAKKLTVKLWGKGIVPKETIYEGSANTNYFVRRSGQVMYGKLDFLNAAFGIVPDDLDGYESTIDAPAFDVNSDADSKFLIETFLQESFYEFQGNLANGSRRAKRINQDDFLNMSINLPNYKEQIAIGNFFDILDTLIELHQRKLGLLVRLKAAYLQQMLVKCSENNGLLIDNAEKAITGEVLKYKDENVPRVRFENFDESWKTCKLGYISDIVAGGDIDNSKLLKRGLYPVIANALTNDGIVGYYDDEFRIKAPAVTVTGRGDVGHAIARKNDFTPVVRLLSIKSNLDADFLANVINRLDIFVESTGVPQLTSPQISEYKISFPNIREQTDIGSFFRNLDDLIKIYS